MQEIKNCCETCEHYIWFTQRDDGACFEHWPYDGFVPVMAPDDGCPSYVLDDYFKQMYNRT